MNDINTIYYNNFGIAFQWKRGIVKDLKKTQLVFRNTGLFLTQKELIQFSYNIKKCVESCSLGSDPCELLFLETLNPQITFAMSHTELKDMQDLIKGTLFQLGLTKILEEFTINKK
ncbi:hypothetical protein A8C32_12565 [Flavivirga aquatica]|uniref:Uncharacterized protein n=1 Tax=Flavivirga aquatica TaxID=1849968 RepID=A0A1E5TDT3_9FLAO|nr:hypothetical protein [Flavivirga aquatica]OEK09534.1 hypothetical protein A8C32_12565 [Flavivirga aquatica]